MKYRHLSLITLGGAALLMSACATKPEAPAQIIPVQKPAEQPRAVMPPPPVAENSAPVQQMEMAPPIAMGPLPGSVEDFSVNAGDRVFFGYNEASLTPQAMTVLRAQGQWLQSYPSTIVVIGGHADERGTREYNLALGARRAEAVKDFLVSQGVQPNRVTTVSYGKERPIDGRATEEAHSLNRNGHTAIISGTNS